MGGGTGFIAKVKSTMKRHEMTKPGDRVLVGVSGGPDSVALLHVLWSLSQELQISLHVGHLNHMLRGAAADEDAAYVQDLARRLGLPVSIESGDVAALAREKRISVELAAREIRYAFYRRAAGAAGAVKVALGHHAGDQAETVLLRLVRGTGTTGLAGIPPVRPLGEDSEMSPTPFCQGPRLEAPSPSATPATRQPPGNVEEVANPRSGSEDDPDRSVDRTGGVHGSDGTDRAGFAGGPGGAGAADDCDGRGCPVVIRPLIEVTRQEIEDYCRENDLRPRVDASNLTSVYARNRVRRELIPMLERHYNPRVVESIARTAELVRDDDRFISDEVRRRMHGIVCGMSPGRVVLSVERLLAEPSAIQRRVVREAVRIVGRGAEDIEFEHVEMVLELARNGRLEASASLPRGIRARKVRRSARPAGPAFASTAHEPGGSTPGYGREPAPESVLEIGPGLQFGRGPDGEPDACRAAQGESPPAPVECRLAVPGVTRVADLGVIVETEVLEAGGEEGDATSAAIARAGADEAYFDLDALGTDLVVRNRRAGDRLSPFGMDGHKKLKELFIDEKVPRNMRDRVPVIVAGSEIVWVVGVRRSSLARVTPSTRRVLRLVVRRVDEARR
ncbi:MAG: tRNA lysidine(34) synthetase TilS [Bacillota bacterium]